MEQVKVSVIIPVYNAEPYLEQCLESVFQQTLREIEAVCIDDGSADSSRDILERLSRENPRIRFLSQDNQGAGAARNRGIDMACGEYVTFLDSDDFYWEETGLEAMYRACREQGARICGSLRKELVEGELRDHELHREDIARHPAGCWIEYRDYQEDYHYHSYMYERKLLEEYHLRFPNYKRFQDPPFFVKCMIAAGRFYVVPSQLYCLRLGHQDFAGYEKKIADTLRGIIDNLKISSEHGYKKLHQITLDRLNVDFYEAIIRNMNPEVLGLLLKAGETIDERLAQPAELLPLKHLETACAEEKERKEQYAILQSQYDVLMQRHREVNLGHAALTNLLFIKQEGYALGDYFKKRGIKRIALYGLGRFGGYLWQELNGAETEIAYGIDRNVSEFKGIHVIGVEEPYEEADALVITPLQYDDIIKYAEKRFHKPILIFSKILEEIAEELKTEGN